MGTTAVFDGVGGAFLSRMIGAFPAWSSIFFYEFLSRGASGIPLGHFHDEGFDDEEV
jgi:hypothetical protein